MKSFNSKTFNFLTILPILLSFQAIQPMMRRLAIKVAPAAFLTHQRRTLTAGQEHDPMWLKVNHEIARFEKQHALTTAAQLKVQAGCADISDQQFLQSTNNVLDKKYKKIHLSKNPVDADGVFLTYTPEEKRIALAIKQDIQNLLAKHGIDPKTIKILFVETSTRDARANMALSGNYFLIYKPALDNTPAERTASIEHEIGHIISFDAAKLILNVKLKKTDPVIFDHYRKLIEKRADTHSAIQSVQNAESIGEVYAPELKDFNLAQLLKTMEKEPIVAKRLKIKDDFIRLSDEPDYMTKLQQYMKRKETQEKALGLPPVIYL